MSAPHSGVGASSMYRWEACPGSVALAATVPAGPSTPYAEEGTHAHTLAAEWLVSGKEPTFPSAEMRDAVKIYVDFCNRYYSSSHVKLGAVRGVETFFDNSDRVPGMYSTVDYWAYWPWLKRLLVADFKYGAGVFVDVEDNTQAQYYAVGLIMSKPDFFQVDTVELAIVQPRCMKDTEVEGIRIAEISRFDLDIFKNRVIQGIGATRKPNAPLVSGKHCRFCPAGALCPEIIRQKDAALAGDFAVIPSDATQVYDVRKLAAALEQREAVKSYLSKLDEFAYQEMSRGVEIPGWKLVEKRGRREYKNPELTMNTLKAAGIPDKDMMTTPELKSPAQLEASLDKRYKGLIAEHTEIKSSGTTIAPASDKRPAVTKKPEDDFQAVPMSLESLGF